MILLLSALLSLLDGNRSVNMTEELNRGALIEYNTETDTFAHNGILYRVIKGSTDDFISHPIISLGMHPTARECIALDPHHSPLLQEKYEEFLTLLQPESSLPSLLETLCVFIREVVFLPELCKEDKLTQYLRHWQLSRERVESDFTRTKEQLYLPVMPLDQFISVRAGVCRHLALVAAYFVNRLSTEGILPAGTVHLVREDVFLQEGSFAHAWVLFQQEQEAWHIDAVWGIVKEMHEDLLYLEETYGTTAMNAVKKRFL